MSSPDMQAMMNQFSQKGGTGARTGAASGFSGMPGMPSMPAGKGQAATGKGLPGQGGPALNQQQKNRPIGTPLQEAKYLAGDIGQGLLGLLPDFLQPILGVKPTDTPEEKARKKQMLQRYTQMNADQQQLAQKKFQEQQAQIRQEEEEKAKKQQAAQQKSASLPAPTGKRTGAAAGQAGQSRKKSMIDDMNQKRQQLSSAG
jgi:hypothetical protein